MYEEYQFFGADSLKDTVPFATGGSPGSIANRVSHLCNFNGPSMAVDTMCSSSLTAIHLACNDLLSGDTDMAIAGGVNVSIHPNKYMLLSQGTFLSSRGRCESFGNNGDGFIPGEGVGAVILKPLSKAKSDGDHIYGIIKSSSLNHGGKTSGYTVPNPNAQGEVIKEAILKSGVSVEDFSYIEAHGTGTILGDPIEISGLSKAFSTDKKQFCRIGSVKSNIGHCESAAGISGLTKILLQLKYNKLVPSLHSEELNTNIDFPNSPFKVQQELEDWVSIDGTPRISGISSFGAGGSNAHIVISEYIGEPVYSPVIDKPVLVVLSAKSVSQLELKVSEYVCFNCGLTED